MFFIKPLLAQNLAPAGTKGELVSPKSAGETNLLSSLWRKNLEREASIPFNFRVLSYFSFTDYRFIDQYNGVGFARVSNRHDSFWSVGSYEPNVKFEIESIWKSGFQIKFSFGVNFLEDDPTSLQFQLANEYFTRLQYSGEWGRIHLDLGGPIWRNWSIMTISGSGGDAFSDNPFERQSWHGIHVPLYLYRDLTERTDAQDLTREGHVIGLKGIFADFDVTPWGLYVGGFYGSTDNGGVFFNEFNSSSFISLYVLEKKFRSHTFGHIAKLYQVNQESQTEAKQENHVFSGYYGAKDESTGNFYVEYAASVVRGNIIEETLGHSVLTTYENNFSDLTIPFIKDLRLILGFYYTGKDFISEYSGVRHTSVVENYDAPTGDDFEEGNHLYNNRLGAKASLTYTHKPFLLNLFYRYGRTLEPVGNRVDFTHELNYRAWGFLYGDFPYAGDNDDEATSLRDHRGGNGESIFLAGFPGANNGHRNFDQLRLTFGFALSHYLPFLRESYFYGYYLQKQVYDEDYNFALVSVNPYGSLIGGDRFYIFWGQRLVSQLYLVSFFGEERFYSDNARNGDRVYALIQNEISAGAGLDFVINNYAGAFLRFNWYRFRDDSHDHNERELFAENDHEGYYLSFDVKIEL